LYINHGLKLMKEMAATISKKEALLQEIYAVPQVTGKGSCAKPCLKRLETVELIKKPGTPNG